jgi:hypothetical protein
MGAITVADITREALKVLEQEMGKVDYNYYMVHTFDGTYNIVQGHPAYNPPAVKTGLTREEAKAFMKLLK